MISKKVKSEKTLAKEILKNTIKNLYLNGKSIKDIALVLGKSEDAIRYHIRKAREDGDDWDALLLAKKRDYRDIEKREQGFLALLITTFEDALEDLKSLPVEKRLSELEKYTASYYKLKAPLRQDCKSLIIEAINKTIYKISELALMAKDDAVIEFLSSNSEKIIEVTLKETKGKN